jgi:hypothetical protein
MDRSQASLIRGPRRVSIASFRITVHEAARKPSSTPATRLVVDDVGNDGRTVGGGLDSLASHLPDPHFAFGPLDGRLNQADDPRKPVARIRGNPDSLNMQLFVVPSFVSGIGISNCSASPQDRLADSVAGPHRRLPAT